MTAAAGHAALCDNDYYLDNCRTIMENRAYTAEALRDLGFEVLPSLTNFVFAKTDRIGDCQNAGAATSQPVRCRRRRPVHLRLARRGSNAYSSIPK